MDLLKKTADGSTVAEFIAKTYQIVSLEKCLYGGEMKTENAFVNASRVLRAANARVGGNVRVMFYYNVPLDVWTCYDAGPKYNATPSWWIYDDEGNIVPTGSNNHYLNSSIPALQEYWTDVPRYLSGVVPPQEALDLVDGVFADGSGNREYSKVSSSRNQYVTNGTFAMLDTLRTKLGASKKVFGNGITAYPQDFDHNMNMLPHMDGACVEHVAAFEQVESDGSLNVTRTATLISDMEQATQMGKMLLVRTWPGPVVQPITSLGPSYPKAYAPTPATYADRAQAALDHVEFSEALYLIVSSNTTFFNYNWWYDVDDGVFPCTEGCSAPASWFPDWNKPLGPPTSPAIRSFKNGTRIGPVNGPQEASLPPHLQREAPIYDRTFQHATVHLDLSSRTNTFIKWE